MHVRRFAIVVAFLLAGAGSAAAQDLTLRFQDGRVTLSAQNVPLRTILNEWSRLGGTKVVNGERVPGGLVTIELNNVPERQALDTLLRSASGYPAGPKPPGAPGASLFASILILPTSSAPRPVSNPAPRVAPVFPVPPPQRFPGQPGFVVGGRPVVAPPPDPDDDPADDVPPPEDEPDDDAPRGRDGRVVGGVVNGRPQPFQPGDDDRPATQAPTPQPGNPFGSAPIGSARPGEITPVPQQPQRGPRSQPDPEP
jgi:hypothetical protein